MVGKKRHRIHEEYTECTFEISSADKKCLFNFTKEEALKIAKEIYLAFGE
jgi:hypothetical protein